MITTTQYVYRVPLRGLGQTDMTATDPFSAAVSNIGSSIQTMTSSWGALEWGLLIFGAFALYSMVFTAGEGIGTITGAVRKGRAKRRRKAELRQEYASL